MVMDIEFAPYDDISYHMLEIKTGIRCVVVRAYNEVRTDYVQRDLQDIVDKLCLLSSEGASVNDIETTVIPYRSNGIEKKIVAIYSSNTYFQGPVIRVNNAPLVYSNACVIVGDKFTDLTIEQCYALVKSARAMTIDRLTTISVNITDNMDTIPRIVIPDEVYNEKQT